MRMQVSCSESQLNLYLTDARFKFLVDSMVPIFLKGVEAVVKEMEEEIGDPGLPIMDPYAHGGHRPRDL